LKLQTTPDASVLSRSVWLLKEPLRLARFACRPRPGEKEAASTLQRIARLAFWMLFVFISDSIYFGLLGDAARSPDVVAAEESRTFFESLLLECTVAPLLEELIFRAGLKSPLYSLCWGVLTVGALYYFAFDRAPFAIATVAIYFTCLLIAFYRRSDASPRQFVNENFGLFYPAVFWSYAVAFGFLHIANLADGVTPHNIPFILPHTLSGLILGYVRIKDGLASAVVLHGCMNCLYQDWPFF
jgi:hypothetical protein